MIPPLQQPLRFLPYYRPMPWGGRAIGRFLGKNVPAGEPIGESWEVSDHPTHASALATGSWYGQTLRQLMQAHRSELLGSAAARYERFPWLIKLLDANETLSVQVHPDEDAVKTLWPGECAKSECWLVLDARPGSHIYAGLKPGVGPAEFRAALQAGAVANCLHRFEPRPGDFVSLPAGTVHALGGGLLVAEVQQTSDATFRLFDWNRRDAHGNPRKLHIEEGLASIHWQQGPIDPIATAAEDDRLLELLSCPHFSVAFIHQRRSFQLGGQGFLQALAVTEGDGRLQNGDFVAPGDVWVLPASMPPMTLHVESRLSGLLCSLP